MKNRKRKISDLPNWSDTFDEFMQDPETKKEYDRLAPEFELISAMISARAKKDLTQAELAKKLGTKQSAIARIESGRGNPTYKYLQKIAKATGTTLHIRFV